MLTHFEALSGLPLSRDSRMANSWVFCSIKSANLYRIWPRSRPVMRGQGPWSNAYISAEQLSNSAHTHITHLGACQMHHQGHIKAHVKHHAHYASLTCSMAGCLSHFRHVGLLPVTCLLDICLNASTYSSGCHINACVACQAQGLVFAAHIRHSTKCLPHTTNSQSGTFGTSGNW